MDCSCSGIFVVLISINQDVHYIGGERAVCVFRLPISTDTSMPRYANISAAKEQKSGKSMMIYMVLFYCSTTVFF